MRCTPCANLWRQDQQPLCHGQVWFALRMQTEGGRTGMGGGGESYLVPEDVRQSADRKLGRAVC